MSLDSIGTKVHIFITLVIDMQPSILYNNDMGKIAKNVQNT